MIRSATFSLVRFEHPPDDGVSLDIPYSLPAYAEHDIAFQFEVAVDRAYNLPIKAGIADTTGAFQSDFAGGFPARLLSYRYRIYGMHNYSSFELFSISVGATTKTYGNAVVTPEALGNILYDDWGIELSGEYFELNQLADVFITASQGPGELFPEKLPVYWGRGYVAIYGAALPDASFTYCLLEEDNTVLGYSNVFHLADENFFTSLIAYSCTTDAFNFSYDGSLENRVRIPMYLKAPDFPKTRSVYRKSGGQNQLLSALVEKQYAIETEQMPEVFHEALTIALAHDSVVITNANIREKTVQVIEVDSYNPAWEGEVVDYPFAKGKGKIKVASFGYSNSNC